MIPVRPGPEPPAFDVDVRQPGLRAIAELVGEAPPRTAGQRHAQVAGLREEIPAAAFPPYWREALDDLLASYDRICVDHMVAKSVCWDQVYEWRNYRLACALMNSRKGVIASVLDPFEIDESWFGLELVEFQVVRRGDLPPEVAVAVDGTIERLRLNSSACCEARLEYAEDYWQRHISVDYLTRHSPFVARELLRQGRLHEEDR